MPISAQTAILEENLPPCSWSWQWQRFSPPNSVACYFWPLEMEWKQKYGCWGKWSCKCWYPTWDNVPVTTDTIKGAHRPHQLSISALTLKIIKGHKTLMSWDKTLVLSFKNFRWILKQCGLIRTVWNPYKHSMDMQLFPFGWMTFFNGRGNIVYSLFP